MNRLDATRCVLDAAGRAPVIASVGHQSYDLAAFDERPGNFYSWGSMGLASSMGLGLALIGRATGQPLWVLLGICGGMLHVWNHALFKSLLFLGAGSVIHAVGTREIDRMGGLAKRMPATANCFLIGAVAICGLPPLNGFVSELLIYLGLFNVATHHEVTSASAAVLS